MCITVYLCIVYVCVCMHTSAAAHKPVREREFGAGFARALQKFRAVRARRANRRSVYFGAYNTYTPAASVAGKGARDYHADCRRTRRLDASARRPSPTVPTDQARRACAFGARAAGSATAPGSVVEQVLASGPRPRARRCVSGERDAHLDRTLSALAGARGARLARRFW